MVSEIYVSIDIICLEFLQLQMDCTKLSIKQYMLNNNFPIHLLKPGGSFLPVALLKTKYSYFIIDYISPHQLYTCLNQGWNSGIVFFSWLCLVLISVYLGLGCWTWYALVCFVSFLGFILWIYICFIFMCLLNAKFSEIS